MRPDTEIAAAVSKMLKWHVAPENEMIKTKVENGIVTLEGCVDWDFQRQAAEDAVRCLPGVLRLDNLIDFKAKSTKESRRTGIYSLLIE